MNAIRAIGILLASLALMSVAEAQKGGGKPGGGTPTPYSPVIVNVACDGTGTKLQDALNALNPFANAYEVRVSGVCPESLTIDKYQWLKIISKDTNAQGSIGKVNIGTSAKSIFLERLYVVDDGSQGNGTVIARNSNLVLSDIEIVCDLSASSSRTYCIAVTQVSGQGKFYNVAFSGLSWLKGRRYDGFRVKAEFSSAANGENVCLGFDTFQTYDGSKLAIVQGSNCNSIRVLVNGGSHGEVNIGSGSLIEKAVLGDLSRLLIYDDGSSTFHELVTETICGDFAVAKANDDLFGQNECPL